jgi:hypothetical protein
MGAFAAQSGLVLPPFVSTFSRYGGGGKSRLITASGSPGAVAWVSGLAVYIPFYLPWPYEVKRVCWVNGSTITSTSVDMGVYTWEGKGIFTVGGVTMTPATDVQFATPATPFMLSPGMYYFGWSCNNTTGRGFAMTGTAVQGRQAGLLEETSAYPLPTDMTPVTWTRAWGPSVVGITRYASGG